ncbi:MAG: hypothetical protein GT601_18265, partial [Acidaminobacter sp.]|uniref:hypothetical protein n=1 Tax=Acidaminobacter sp. TaxID=1872102 RepID=UPI00137E4D7D
AGIQDRSIDQKNYSNAATLAGAAEVYCIENSVDTVDIATLITGEFLRGVAADYDNYTLTVTDGEATVTLSAAGETAGGTLVEDAVLFPKP